MTASFDPTLKALVETSPADWLTLLGLPRAPVAVLDADIATVIAGAADKVLHVHADPAYLLHLDFQAGHDTARLPERLWLYNTALDVRQGLPVHSVAVLLQPGSDSPRLTGRLERQLTGAAPHAVFRYRVLRVWQVPVSQVLAGGVGTLPLAPLSALGELQPSEVIQRMQERLGRGRRRRLAAEVWAATYVLLGARFTPDVARLLLREVLAMKESTTYQAILQEGKTEEAREFLLRLGRKRFGRPGAAVLEAIQAITDVQRLEELGELLLEAESWEGLLGLAPGHSRRPKGRR